MSWVSDFLCYNYTERLRKLHHWKVGSYSRFGVALGGIGPQPKVIQFLVLKRLLSNYKRFNTGKGEILPCIAFRVTLLVVTRYTRKLYWPHRGEHLERGERGRADT